ncbi:something about silencing protein 10 [Asparagus officinalis]|uniref:something about silencing protein 10 n=1 Tax=Asparagus officinalis TaxID=4686 RepID=UPI00098E851B|nr:something about silencing protein 10 [Asparagus officinalis]XP_020244739.1 something about silencing protein 10 [Asparagus officinalis]
MGKGSKRPRKPSGKKSAVVENEDYVFREEDIDDEVDAFHKQRDMVPLSINGDAADSDEEMEQSVFDLEGHDEDSQNSKSEDDGDEEDDDDGVDEEVPLKGFAAKIARQAKYLKQKFGGVDDDMNDDDNEDEDEGKKVPWGRKKDRYYNADNVDVEHQSSDEDLLKEEENEVVKIQREKAHSFAMEDFGLEDDNEVDSDSDGQEKAFKGAFAGNKTSLKNNVDASLVDNPFDSYEKVRKDLTCLSKEEQMEVVYSSAPELVGLLTELDKALNQLKQVKSLLSEVSKEKKDTTGGLMKYLEVKQILLLTFCQAIGFYLLLKSEGHSVRDHPVIARLVEIKNLLEKMEQIDLPSQIEDIVNLTMDAGIILAQQSVPMDSEPNMTNASARPSETADLSETTQSIKGVSKDFDGKNASKNIQVDLQSMEMLKIRANLEAKLKQKGIYNSSNLNPEATQNHVWKPANQRLETLDDYDDEVQLSAKGHHDNNSKTSLLPSKLVSTKAKKLKLISGDEDLPKRDDIGERRRKHELRVMARAGTKSLGDGDDYMEDEADDIKETMAADATMQEEDGDEPESEDEFYTQVKKRRANKLIAKAQLYGRTPAVPNPSPLEIGEEDKRQITYQMEKNRGLTRNRKKLTKNPRKKYKIKHQKAVTRRKGQVRDIRKPTGPYGGEASGVNANVSRSIRFKN